MGDDVVVPFGPDPAATATALLAAAQSLALPLRVVVATGDATFLVPRAVADAAVVSYACVLTCPP